MNETATPPAAPTPEPAGITLKEIKAAEQALTSILMTKVDFKLAYRIEKISKKLVAQIEKIEDQRLKLVDKYGEPEKDKDGKETGRTQVPPAKHKAFNDEFSAWLDQPADLDVQKIPYELLETSQIKLSSADVMALEKFITEPKVPING